MSVQVPIPPRDDLYRAQSRAMELRAAAGDDTLGTLTGHFSVFDTWYEVDSFWEGHFLERVAAGAFTDTIANDRSQMRVTFNHGQDPQLGDKVLGPIDVLEEDKIGARYEVPLLDTTYNRDLVPGLRRGLYGSSFRFSVEEETFDRKPEKSDHNPDGIPERTITRARVAEFGPVTYPANAAATAAVRSITDQFRPAPVPAPTTPAPARKETPVSTAIESPAPPAPVPTAVSRADRPARIEELRSLANAFVNEHTGTLSLEQQAEWDGITSELRQLEADQKADDERREILASLATQERSTVPGASIRERLPQPFKRERVRDIYDLAEIRAASNGQDDERQLLRDSAMRSVESKVFPHPSVDQARAKAQAQELLDQKDTPDKEIARRMLQTGSPMYERAFGKLVRGDLLTPEEQRAAIAVVGTTTTGGYAVPYQFDPTIIHTGAYTSINPYRQICRVEQIAGANVWRGVSAGAITAQYRAEAAAMTENAPAFALPTYTAQRADAFVTLSREALQDRPDLASELATIIDEGKATLEENQFSIGVGTTVYPKGALLSGAFTVKLTATNDVFAVGDLDAVEADLPIRHRALAVWLLSRAVIRIIQGWETAYGKLFNSTLGYPAVGNIETNPGGNTGLSLLGYPVWETPSAPSTVTTDAAIVGLLFSPRNYIIVDRIGMEVEIIPNMFDATTGFPTGQRGLQAFWRNTAGPVNADAGRQIKIQ